MVSSKSPKIYVAGPISKGNMLQNCIRAVKVADKLWKLGYLPFCPHQSWFWQQVCPHDHKDWIEYDLPFVAICDAVLRIPGISKGADMEVAFAQNHNIPVYYSIRELQQKCPIFSERKGKW
jgi:hypothetical protein